MRQHGLGKIDWEKEIAAEKNAETAVKAPAPKKDKK